MDSLVLGILAFLSGLCWLAVMLDQRAIPALRAASPFGIAVLFGYVLWIIDQTRSPVWNDLTGGWLGLAALAGGFMAFISKEEPAKPPTTNRGAT